MLLAATVMTVLSLAAGAEPAELEPTAIESAVEPPNEPTPEPDPEVEPPVDPAIEALQRAQQQIADQRVAEALESLEQALAIDDTLAAAYLTRAQLLIDQLGDPDERPQEVPNWDTATIARARLAASDLARYLEQVEISEDDAAPLELQRVRLLLQADKAEARLAQGPSVTRPPAVVSHDPPLDPRPPRRWVTDPLGGALTFGGLGLIGGGVTTLVVGRRRHGSAGDGSEQQFGDDTRSGRTLNAVGIGLAALGGSLVVGGIVRYVLVSRRARAASRPRPAATRWRSRPPSWATR